MLNLQSDEQEINAADNDILEVVFALAVLEFNVQTVLDTDIHLNAAVHLGRDAVAINPNVLFANDIGHAAGDGDAHKVPQLDIDAVVRLVLLLDVFEVEVKGLRVLQFPGSGEFLVEREEFVVVAAVEEHLDGAYELHLDAGVFEAFAILGADGDGALDGLAVHVEGGLFAAVLVELDVDHGAVVGIFEDDVDVHGGGEEVRHGGWVRKSVEDARGAWEESSMV